MFDIGFSELLVIAVVALVVLGPERLPKAARFAGLWVRKARAQWYSVKAEFEREVANDELRRSVSEAGREIKAGLDQTSRAVSEATRTQVPVTPVAHNPDAPAVTDSDPPGANTTPDRDPS